MCRLHSFAATNYATMNNFIHLSVYVGVCQQAKFLEVKLLGQRECVLVNLPDIPRVCSTEVVLIYNLTQQVLKVLASSGALQMMLQL